MAEVYGQPYVPGLVPRHLKWLYKKIDKIQLSSMSYKLALRYQILSEMDGSQEPNPYFLQ